MSEVRPDEWLARLSEQLKPISHNYRLVMNGPTEADVERATDNTLDESQLQWARSDLARQSLQVVIQALHEIPNFSASGLLRPLNDILAAFANLGQGLDPELFTKRAAAPRGRDSVENNLVRCRLVACILMLRSLRNLGKGRWTDGAIFKLLRREFGSFENASLGPADSTMASWAKSGSRFQLTFSTLINGNLAQIHAHPAWPFEEAQAEEVVRNIAQAAESWKKRS